VSPAPIWLKTAQEAVEPTTRSAMGVGRATVTVAGLVMAGRAAAPETEADRATEVDRVTAVQTAGMARPDPLVVVLEPAREALLQRVDVVPQRQVPLAAVRTPLLNSASAIRTTTAAAPNGTKPVLSWLTLQAVVRVADLHPTEALLAEGPVATRVAVLAVTLRAVSAAAVTPRGAWAAAAEQALVVQRATPRGVRRMRRLNSVCATSTRTVVTLSGTTSACSSCRWKAAGSVSNRRNWRAKTW
jgi:hypothetical protein